MEYKAETLEQLDTCSDGVKDNGGAEVSKVPSKYSPYPAIFTLWVWGHS